MSYRRSLERPILSWHFVHPSPRLGISLVLACLLGECGDGPDSGLPTGAIPLDAHRIADGPRDLAPNPIGSGTVQIWPYLSADLETTDDPVSLVLTGNADPRAIRNALLGLSGNRGPTFPPVAPFDCTWSDAIGGLMAGFGASNGWGGAAVQLQCGQYGPIRFHMRLVKMGVFTLGNIHFEVLIPGTTDHQVLSWELAEQLATFDLARTGLLGGPPTRTALINSAPTQKTIPAPICNGLPVELRGLIGGPLGNVASDVGIANDGHAMAFHLQGEAAPTAGNTDQHLVLQFNQVIPKPYCASGPLDFVLVQGPVSLDQEIRTLHRGALRQVFRAYGALSVIPFDIITTQPSGPPLSARLQEEQDSRAESQGGTVKGTQQQAVLPEGAPGTGRLTIRINLGPHGRPQFVRDERCE